MARVILIAGILGATLVGTAEAGLEICNDTGASQSIAIGYKGATDWTSEGWWNVRAGDCSTVIAGDLTKRYYYYFADSEAGGFRGQDYVFCTTKDEFTIVGDTDCADRGYSRTEFREIDTGEKATSFTLTLVNSKGAPGSGTKAPGGGGVSGGAVGSQSVTETPTEETVDVGEDALSTGRPPGRNGEAFKVAALFQGCELEDGKAYCGFHAGGVKLRAYYSGPTEKDLMFALEEMPVNTPVLVEGDQIDNIRLHAAVVLRKVEPRPGSDAMAGLRARLQGEWTAVSDARSEMTIQGSEIYARYDGDYRQTRFVELAARCAGLTGEGPVMVQTSLRDRVPACFRIVRADARNLELQPVAGGKKQVFRR